MAGLRVALDVWAEDIPDLAERLQDADALRVEARRITRVRIRQACRIVHQAHFEGALLVHNDREGDFAVAGIYTGSNMRLRRWRRYPAGPVARDEYHPGIMARCKSKRRIVVDVDAPVMVRNLIDAAVQVVAARYVRHARSEQIVPAPAAPAPRTMACCFRLRVAAGQSI